MKKSITLAASGLIALFSAKPSWALSPCETDIQTFCKDVQPGEGRQWDCLGEHLKSLSPACQEYRTTLRKALTGVPKVCFDEADDVCGDVLAAKKGGMKACLKSHMSQMSPTCQAKLSQPRKKKTTAN
jgi:Cysteine rich repeat